MKELSKAYEPKKYEDGIYKRWLDSGFFNPDVCIKEGVCKKTAKPFSIVLPPPNVTGTLHMGHAVMLAIQDVMVRYHRMKGDKTLWLPGADHAAIATQTKVEKLLMEKGMKDPRKELGREKFLEEVNNFAQESHDTIVSQCKKMGSSLDWTREAFTLDEKRSLAVRTMFKKMFDDGLIERGYRIVNWCPRCHSTLADDEVEYREQSAKVYTFKYSEDFPISIATTRPETKLGDTAVAVNPKDERYKKYIGKVFEVRNFGGLPAEVGAKAGPDLKIKIISEPSVDMSFGSGAVGVTPAHSIVDYEMAQKNKLPVIKVIDEDGKMTAETGKYAGMPAIEARKKVVEYLVTNNLLEKEENIPNNLSVCYRCQTPIEPLPSRQWFIDVNKEIKGKKASLKQLMTDVVKNGEIEIIPDRFKKTYFHWIDNLRNWCISRQIWYGHRIPVWYKKSSQFTVHSSQTENREMYVDVNPPKDLENWEQDSDTLDTWFSSGLWTFSVLGWPKETADLKNFHPTSVMETGYDILFFWVARMILMTTYALGEIPFEKVYLHGLVRDEQGRKMSKSLGNVINPLDMIDKYGADATRLSLLLGNTPGNDIRLSEEKIDGFRNFTNKLWNICRFMLLNIDKPKADIKKPVGKTSSDKWILLRLNDISNQVMGCLEGYNFSMAGEMLRDFTWGTLADWYLEMAKIEGDKSEILNYILNNILKIWHPFMPFVTEQIWQEIYKNDNCLMIQKYPECKLSKAGANVEAFISYVIGIITNIRSRRADYKIEPAKKLNVVISAGHAEKFLKNNEEIIKGLSRIENLKIAKKLDKPQGSIGFVVSGMEVFIDLSGLVDTGKEKERLNKEIAAVEPYLTGLEKKLSNQEFVSHAPKEVVEKEKQKLSEAREKLKKLKEQLKNLI